MTWHITGTQYNCTEKKLINAMFMFHMLIFFNILSKCLSENYLLTQIT